MSFCQAHQDASLLWFMYLIKTMLSNFNLSEGLTTANASAFYIRQLFHRLCIGLMESVLLPFPRKDGWREGERVKTGGRERKILRIIETDGTAILIGVETSSCLLNADFMHFISKQFPVLKTLQFVSFFFFFL